MSPAPAGTPLQRPSLPAKAPSSRTPSGLLRPNPNPSRPHRPASQNVSPQDLHTSQLASFSRDVGSAMDIDPPGAPSAPRHSPTRTTAQSSFIAAVLGPQPKDQAQPVHVAGRKIPFSSRPTRNADNSLTVFAFDHPKTTHGQTAAATDSPQNVHKGPAPTPNNVEPVADCHPWTGDHNEDKLSEQVIKFGYTEKQRFSLEGSTARPILCARLGKGSGLQGLSTLFMSVLQQRKEAGSVTSQSTFKPPPRVTLTDSKREAWLRDLADEKCPLRRLSRTIPHGVRGKTLLEQCQTKQVPMPRAVWLVRCVGANELRAFRRKGVSATNAAANEVKWIKDWTLTITSFLEDSICLSPTPDARQRIFYATRLATRLFEEKLMDHQQFLSWLLSFFESSAPARLPMACILVQIFWHHLTRNFGPSQRLAQACAARLVRLPSLQAVEPLVKRLRQMLESLVESAPDTLIFNGSWTSVKPAFATLAEHACDSLTEKLRKTMERNDAMVKLAPDDPSTHVDGQLALIRLLDTYDFSYPIDSFLDKCVNTVSSKPDLITLTLHYAASILRTGRCNILLAATVIRKATSPGLDLTPLILSAITTLRNNHNYYPERMSSLLAELSRTHHFDAGRYLRWIMTGGILNGLTRAALPSNFAARYVQDMSTHDLPENTRNLRRMLLQAIQAYDDETSNLAAAQNQLTTRLFEVLGDNIQAETVQDLDLEASLAQMSLTTRHALSAWLVAKVKTLITQSVRSTSSQNPAECPVSSGDFVQMRTILETGQSPPILLELLELLIPACDMELLPHLLDTLYAWRDAARTLAKFDHLVQATLVRYRSLRPNSSPVRDVVLALVRLVSSDPKYARIKKALDPEVEICTQNAGAMPFTPASEMMVDASEAAGSFEHELDRLVSNGASLDAHSVGQVFDLLHAHTKLDRKHALAIVTNSGPLLARLADCAPAAFGKAVMAWMKEVSKLATESELYSLVVSLVGSNILAFQSALEAVKDSPGAIRVLLGHPSELNSVATDGRESYCYETDVRDFLAGEPLQLLDALLSSASIARVQVDTLFAQVLVSAAVKNSEETAKLLRQNHAKSLDGILGTLYGILDPSGKLASTSVEKHDLIRFLFKNVDPIILPVFQLAMQLIRDDGEIFVKEVEAAVLTAISSRSPCWPELVGSAGSGIANTIRQQAEEQLYKARPDLHRPSGPGTEASDFATKIQRDLDVVGATAYSIGDEKQSSAASKVVGQLGVIAKYIAMSSSPEQSSRPSEELAVWTKALLRMALVHRRSFTTVAGVKDLQKLLCTAGIIMSAAPELVDAPVRTFAYDVAAVFIADTAPSTVAHIRGLEAHIAHDARARFLFGADDAVAAKHAWLHLVTAVRPMGFAASRQQQQHPQAQQSVVQHAAPFVPRPFELLPDSTPHVGANDTALSLRLFGARREPRVGY